MATIAPYGIYQAFDDNGDPLSGGFLYTYEAGTTTPKATYTTADGDIENDNPVELDASGQASVWLGDGGYKFKLTDSLGNIIFVVDNIGGTSDAAFGALVNMITTNTIINVTYKNSVNIATNSPTLSLLSTTSAVEGFYFSVKNQGSGNVTVDPDGGEFIDGVSTKIIGPGQSALIITDGAAWYTLFYYDVTGSGNNIFSGNNTFSGSNTFTGKVLTPSDGTLTISSGAITPTGAYHLVDTEASAAIDQLDTISGPVSGERLTLRSANDARDIILTQAGNIVTPSGANVLLSSTASTISLLYDGTLSKWIVQSTAIPSALMAGSKNRVLNGMTLSNNVADATNDIDISAGSCVSDDGTAVMTLTSSITKQTDVVWTVGSGNGGLDTGVVGNNTYHVWVINRPDTNVTDVLFSLSATAPTMPTNYTLKKCIGSVIRSGGAVLAFTQILNEFYLSTPIIVQATNPGTAAVTRATGVPTGVKFLALLQALAYSGTGNPMAYVSSLDSADLAPQVVATASLTGQATVAANSAATNWNASFCRVITDTSAQVRTRLSVSGVADRIGLITLGWVDPRL